MCCSSPERFLKLDRQGVLEARPIKGTAARVLDDPQKDAAAAQQLAASEKDRAENLMIVDLLRNDLGCICEPCSVHVPGLMEVCTQTRILYWWLYNWPGELFAYYKLQVCSCEVVARCCQVSSCITRNQCMDLH